MGLVTSSNLEATDRVIEFTEGGERSGRVRGTPRRCRRCRGRRVESERCRQSQTASTHTRTVLTAEKSGALYPNWEPYPNRDPSVQCTVLYSSPRSFSPAAVPRDRPFQHKIHGIMIILPSHPRAFAHNSTPPFHSSSHIRAPVLPTRC
jgi:hypothetical protein